MFFFLEQGRKETEETKSPADHFQKDNKYPDIR